MIYLPKGEQFSTLDVAKFCNVEHQEVKRRLVNLMSSGGCLPEREATLIKPIEGTRKRSAYVLSTQEFIYLVFKLHTGNFDKIDKLLNLILADKEISKLPLFFSEIKLDGTGVNVTVNITGSNSLGAGNKESKNVVSEELMNELFNE